VKTFDELVALICTTYTFKFAEIISRKNWIISMG